MRLPRVIFALLCGAASVAYAQNNESVPYKDWSVTPLAKGFYASTTNDDNELFAKRCLIGFNGCEWVLMLNTTCDTNHESVVLVNSDAGTEPLTIKCIGRVENSQSYFYEFENFQAVESALKQGDTIGFALAMLNGQFKVVRFSLAGESDADAQLQRSFAERMKHSDSESDSQGTRDQTL